MGYTPKNNQERILHRFKISLGHLKKVIQMMEQGSYCINVIHQSQAVQRALKNTDHLLLEDHLRTCVADAMTSSKKDVAIKEVVEVFKRSK
ncbi:hypothetical protein A3H85_02555 [Candidatus Daviesbacteria bacterium RIFCSPLOWO2_02_FULL_40_8]|uniref:Transcriptional regulator n=1 Tax=Candidatus Daviesbacteria bacterium RIFCSPLOWO2_01_FULL_40_24 TaxID=1797787 RepID=A0A1F5MIG9_9BACT|nr:MAG: hypothetical protein A2780_03285 [Candidatus Daviesbacteria bacterium RIFCSPHIGHO2_01_FULL_41_45]OGE34171.1 MAG: hypothetical protein A3C32_00370 [Candidatus Daviesbacteria bacterium RIFCSPHIGHO2_02_FULL_41_14]OGE65155.1 MAG: hypothetical protein A3B49_01320 [Candidatus Daviesbacteria bacterium RIFCSPLOWO2_01_FULL_40_24]OGE66858.1 MAG: hypothetical protein A3H85_02555 [Candidatus Daviesbacteria bacterium RIFCSPLOWO2_02_FULL_40_8]